MCRAIDEMRRESRKEGVKQGMKKGVKKGIKKGVKKGVKQGIKQGEHSKLLESTRSLIANTGWDAMQALRMLGVPEDDRSAIARELGAL